MSQSAARQRPSPAGAQKHSPAAAGRSAAPETPWQGSRANWRARAALFGNDFRESFQSLCGTFQKTSPAATGPTAQHKPAKGKRGTSATLVPAYNTDQAP